MKVENWKNVVGYEGKYMVSDFGRVKSMPRTCAGKNGSIRNIGDKILSLIKATFNRRQVLLYTDGTSKMVFVHRLVATAFIPNPQNYPVVNHLDSDPSNNNVDNLEWCTSKRNAIHARDAGRLVGFSRIKNPQLKLNNTHLDEIKTARKNKMKYKDISKQFGISISHVHRILTGERTPL